jgi:peroxiredoxin Q/BCP
MATEEASGLKGHGKIIGKKAPDFTLKDHKGGEVTFSKVSGDATTLLVFYPGDFTPVCTKQLCTYRDRDDDFKSYGVQILGISSNSPESHAKFAEAYNFPFLLLSDPKGQTAKEYDCTSFMMLGRVSRAVFIVNKKGVILYRYVEPTILTRRKPEELVAILDDLKVNGLLL